MSKISLADTITSTEVDQSPDRIKSSVSTVSRGTFFSLRITCDARVAVGQASPGGCCSLGLGAFPRGRRPPCNGWTCTRIGQSGHLRLPERCSERCTIVFPAREMLKSNLPAISSAREMKKVYLLREEVSLSCYSAYSHSIKRLCRLEQVCVARPRTEARTEAAAAQGANGCPPAVPEQAPPTDGGSDEGRPRCAHGHTPLGSCGCRCVLLKQGGREGCELRSCPWL